MKLINQDNQASGQEIVNNWMTELNNIEAEQTILGTIIINNEYFNRVTEFLLPEHFYEPANQKIFEQISQTINKSNIIANQITLKQFFSNDEAVKGLGGISYLSTLLSRATGIIDITDYGKLVYVLIGHIELFDIFLKLCLNRETQQI